MPIVWSGAVHTYDNTALCRPLPRSLVISSRFVEGIKAGPVRPSSSPQPPEPPSSFNPLNSFYSRLSYMSTGGLGRNQVQLEYQKGKLKVKIVAETDCDAYVSSFIL